MLKLLKTVTFLLLLLFVTVPVHAQTTSTPSSSVLPTTNYQLPTYVSTSPIYTDLIVNNMFHTFSCLMAGVSVIGQPCLTYQVQKTAQGTLQTVPVLSEVNLSGGALGATTSLIGLLYANPPVRTTDFLTSISDQIGLVQTAHAQVSGSGADILKPVFTLWKVSRDISYILMIIVFIVIGIMVLFRNKINPQTVITAQAALPGLVIGLLLITFSYFLAGLISDMAFIGTNLVGYYFSLAGSHPTQNLVSDLANQHENVLSIFSKLIQFMSKDTVSSAISNIWSSLTVPNSNPNPDPFYLDPARVLTIASAFIATQLLSPLGGLFPGVGQVLTSLAGAGITLTNPTAMIGFSLAFIAMLALIYAMFKLLLRLINAFIGIIFLTITAPFHFLAAALPGRQGIATKWLLDMVSHVLAFPAVIAVFYFVAFIIGPGYAPLQNTPFIILQAQSTNSQGLVPQVSAADIQSAPSAQIVGNYAFPLFGGFDLNFIKLLLVFGALMATPNIPEIVLRTVSEVSEGGQLLGQELSGNINQGRNYAAQFREAPGGLLGQAGRLTNEPGYELTSSGYKLVGPDHDLHARVAAGERPGLIGKIGARLRGRAS